MSADTDKNTNTNVEDSIVGDVVDLKALALLLTQLLQEHQHPPQPVPAEDASEDVDTGDTTFRYRLLRSLMTATPVNRLVAVVERSQNGLDLDRSAGLTLGTHLSFVTGGKPVELKLYDDRVHPEDLKQAGIDVNAAFEAFVLREGPGGPAVAVAPSLPAKPATTSAA